MVEAVAADVVDVVDENIEKVLVYEYVLYVKRIRVFSSPFFQSDRLPRYALKYKDAKYNIRVIKNIGTVVSITIHTPYHLYK